MNLAIDNHHHRLRTADAASYCGLSKSTFDKYRLTGEGPAFLKLGRSVVYDTADLDTWLTANRQSSTASNEQEKIL